MKTIIALVILIPVLHISCQTVNGQSKFSIDKLYLKTGFVYGKYSNVTNVGGEQMNHRDNLFNFVSSIEYDYTDRLQFELLYEYFSEFGYASEEHDYEIWNEGDNYYHRASTSFKSHAFYLKANYFVLKDRRINPIYFTGALSFAVQPVKDFEEFTYESGKYVQKQTSYLRYLIGPQAGFGIYFDIGLFNFQTEFNLSARGSVLNYSRFVETNLNVSVAGVFHL